MDQKQKESIILELYKCHFTPLEVSKMFGVHRGTIAYRFQGFKITGVKKHDRLSLMDSSILGIFKGGELNAVTQ